MVHGLFFLCALVSVATTVGVVFSLVVQSLDFFGEVSPIDFITGTRWSPILIPSSFGVLPLVGGTVLVAVLAAAVALPVGLSTAIFLSEYAPDRARRIIKPALEILAGVPTVVYGFFALTFVTPQLQHVIPDLLIFNALSAGIVMGLMIIPMVSSLSEDAMLAVPRSLREAAYALGATRLEVSLRVVVPAALSGIVTAFIIGISRAIGEDDAGFHRRRGHAQPHDRSDGEHPDHDRLHRPAVPRRVGPRLHRVQHHLRRRPAPVPHDPEHEPAGSLDRRTLEGEVLNGRGPAVPAETGQ